MDERIQPQIDIIVEKLDEVSTLMDSLQGKFYPPLKKFHDWADLRGYIPITFKNHVVKENVTCDVHSFDFKYNGEVKISCYIGILKMLVFDSEIFGGETYVYHNSNGYGTRYVKDTLTNLWDESVGINKIYVINLLHNISDNLSKLISDIHYVDENYDKELLRFKNNFKLNCKRY